jgi:hypothetical protein
MWTAAPDSMLTAGDLPEGPRSRPTDTRKHTSMLDSGSRRRNEDYMQTVVRVISILLAPILTLAFASKLGGLTIAGKSAGEAVGGAIAGLIVLVVEVGLTQAPKHSAWLRRWLDPRAAFERAWLQEVSVAWACVLVAHAEAPTHAYRLQGKEIHSGNSFSQPAKRLRSVAPRVMCAMPFALGFWKVHARHLASVAG